MRHKCIKANEALHNFTKKMALAWELALASSACLIVQWIKAYNFPA